MTRRKLIRVALALLFLSLMATIVGLAKAQQPKPKADTEPTPTASQQSEFAQAFRDASETKRTVADAQVRADAAQSRLDAIVFKIMAQLKLSPDDYQPQLDKDGKLGFAVKPKPVPSPTPKPSPSL